MATTGTNYTTKWELVDGVLTISPVSGNSGEMRGPWHILTPEAYITKVIDMTDEEWNSVTSIVFVGDITIKAQDAMGYYYCYVANLFTQMGAGTLDVASIPNVTSIDVRGLNTTNCESFSNMFYKLTSLTEIIGIDTLNMSAVTDYSGMFEYTKLSELDLSSFSNMNTAKISSMIMAMNYLSTLTLPSNFSRTSPLLNNQDATYQGFGIANSQIYATNSQTQVTISSDNDFFALETGQGGTWIRDISGSATLSFKINSVQRDENNVTVSYSYATSTATAYVYLKESSASSFPQNPTTSIPLSGTGNDSFTLTLSTDGSYEMQIIVTDGNTNLYVFASIDSNVLLIELDPTGNTKQSGRATTKDMTTQEVDDFVNGLDASGSSWEYIPLSSSNPSMYINPAGGYYKLGRFVLVQFRCYVTGTFPTNDYNIVTSGLPVPSLIQASLSVTWNYADSSTHASAVVSNTGSLVVQSGSKALTSSTLFITGSYITE